MAGGTFNGVGSPYTFDHQRDAFYRAQEEQRRIRDRAARAEFWLAGRLEGQRFASKDEMIFATTQLARTLYGSVDDELTTVIGMACGELWKQDRYHALTVAAK